MSFRLATRYESGFHCPRCNLYGTQEWRALGHQLTDDTGDWFVPLDTEPSITNASFNVFETSTQTSDPWGTRPDQGRRWVVSEDWATSKCFGCGASTVWHREQIIYPATRAAPIANSDMPSLPRELYEEASRVMPVSRRAGAAMARATLERLLIELDPMPKSDARLDDRIVHVVPRVSSGLETALTIIRHVGNKALHVAEDPDAALVLVLDDENTEIVDVIFSAINDLVDELVSKPAARERLLGAIPSSVLEAVERKKNATAGKDEPAQ